MATTEAGTLLTSAYRSLLARQRAATVADWMTLWRVLDFRRLEDTYPAWQTGAKAIIARDRQLVTADTRAYLSAFKVAEVGELPNFAGPDALPDALVDTSLRVTSYVAYFRGTRKFTDVEASARALVQSSGTATRLVLNAGRSATFNTLRRDPRGAAWERVAAPSACPFCSSLTGKTSRVEASVDFPAHDHCLCSVEPVYR